MALWLASATASEAKSGVCSVAMIYGRTGEWGKDGCKVAGWTLLKILTFRRVGGEEEIGSGVIIMRDDRYESRTDGVSTTGLCKP